MPLFRKHTGSYEDSMTTAVVVKDMAHLREFIYISWLLWEGHITKDGREFNLNSFNIKIAPYGTQIDERNGWHTQIVTADLIEDEKYIPVGFLSEPME